MGSSAFEISIILFMLTLHRKDIYGFECRKLRNYPVFTALSGIFKIHGIAPEYKYYAIFLE